MKKRMQAVLAGRGRARRGGGRAPAARRPVAEPLRVGGVRFENRLVQAPLAGIANWAFRSQSRRHGAGLTVSEMIASFGIRYANRKTLGMLTIVPGEHPVSVQVFGADADAMAEAARAVEEAGADMVDVNMGCPVPKICKTGAGAALLRDPEHAARDRRGDGPGGGHPRDREDAPRRDAVRGAPRRGRRGASSMRAPPRSACTRARRPRSTAAPPTTASRPRWSRRSRCRSSPAATSTAPTTPAACWTRRAAPRSPSAGPRSATRGCSATSSAAPTGRGRRWRRWWTSSPRSPPTPASPWATQRATGYLRKFYPWYLAGYPVAGVRALGAAHHPDGGGGDRPPPRPRRGSSRGLITGQRVATLPGRHAPKRRTCTWTAK